MAAGVGAEVGAGVTREVPTFGVLLRRCRLAAGLTHEGLAGRAGLSVRAISDRERGISRQPRHDNIALVADAQRLAPDQRTGCSRPASWSACTATSAAAVSTPPTRC